MNTIPVHYEELIEDTMEKYQCSRQEAIEILDTLLDNLPG